MKTSADHLKETIEQILKDIETKLLEEQLADRGQIVVQKIQNEIQESDVRDLVILKQQLGMVLKDMENMDTRAAFKYMSITLLRAMMTGSSSKDRLDDEKKFMEDLENKATNFQMDRNRRIDMKGFLDKLEGKFERDLELIGREKEKEEIIDQLILHGRSGEVPVIIIAGLAGIGKTKLARYVCKEVKQQVGMAVWVSGTKCNTFDADSIAKQAIGSVETAAVTISPTTKNLDIIVILDDWRLGIEDKDVKALQDKLKENWRVEIESKDLKALQKEEVDKLKEASPLVTAVMIITTSSCHVAMARNITASPAKSYALPELNEKEIVSILQLSKIDVEAGDHWIVGKSRGVPRALLTAIMLWSNSQLTDSGLMEQLTYSYYDEGLPHLCFAYCSLFPQDYLFDAERLIHLWMAEGFLKEEEIGRKYLMNLVGRSIFQDVKEDELGQVRSFRMHPLMHDIARFVADRENITVDPKGYKVHQKVLRASFDLRLHFSHGISSHPLFDKAKQLRSILFFAAKTQSSLLHRHVDLENIFKSFKLLVVLDLRGLKITAVPNSIGELKSLEYLDLSQNDMEKLPSSIAKLSMLQTLKLSSCYWLRELPKDFNKLGKLKHLDMEGCIGLTGMPPQMSKLSETLQTLTAFVASKNETMGGLEELAKLNQLRGYLEILYLDRVPKPHEKTKNEYLKEKQHLQRLKLKWDLGDENCSHHLSILDLLEPHSHLGVLILEGYRGESLSATWLTSFQSLIKLSLQDCHGCKYLSPKDQLPKLKILELVRLENLYSVVEECDKNADFYKTLQELTIIDCPALEGWYPSCKWPEEVGIFARISKLHVHNCPKLERMPILDMVLEGSTSTSFGKELVLEGSSLKLLLESVKYSIPFESVHIQNCKVVEEPSNIFQHLDSFQRHTIENCAEINLEDGKSNQYWKSLRFLTLREIPNLRSLPFGDSITTLCELTLHSCHGLTSISDGIGKLTSLRRLEISKCNKLKSLPKEMENLKSLKTLIILDCALLLPRCQEETGADWPLIRHIKHRDVK